MHRHLPQLSFTAAAVAATLALAACGGSGTDSGADSSTSSPATPAGSGKTVTVQRVDGIGSVLVGSTGKALYTPDQEADGKVRCTGACASDWQPLSVDSGSPSADAGAGKLAVIRRPDGTKQVTAGGKPLYTFVQDAPGQVTGDGFSDDFEGRHFTWHAVLAGGESSSGSSTTGSGSREGNGY
jgi:predicted lipoprotein with Yx(FWY)xxD motif